jgi:putative transcriptional regulator
LSKIDWQRLGATSDAAIDQQIAEDSDTAPVFTPEELQQAKPVIPPSAAEDVKHLRQKLGLSQEQFAQRFGFSVETIRNYEQGHRKPNGPARVLLRVIAAEPDAVTRALIRD